MMGSPKSAKLYFIALLIIELLGTAWATVTVVITLVTFTNPNRYLCPSTPFTCAQVLNICIDKYDGNPINGNDCLYGKRTVEVYYAGNFYAFDERISPQQRPIDVDIPDSETGIFLKVDAVDGNSQRVARFAQKVTAQALIRTEGNIPITMSGSPQSSILLSVTFAGYNTPPYFLIIGLTAGLAMLITIIIVVVCVICKRQRQKKESSDGKLSCQHKDIDDELEDFGDRQYVNAAVAEELKEEENQKAKFEKRVSIGAESQTVQMDMPIETEYKNVFAY